MMTKEKTAELERYRALVQATLDYQIERLGGSFVSDGQDAIKEYYGQQKVKAEKYFSRRKLQNLQQQLERLTIGLRNQAHLQFSSYIKENTNYELDLFADLQMNIKRILSQGNIATDEEAGFVILQLQINKQTTAEPQQDEALTKLLLDYEQQKLSSEEKTMPTEVIKREEKDGVEMVTMRVTSGPKRKHEQEQEIIAPDGKRRLNVVRSGSGKHSSTYISIIFETASGLIYATSGIREDVKAHWKDNHTIVIETKKEYEAGVHVRKVSSFDDVIAIEYIEN